MTLFVFILSIQGAMVGGPSESYRRLSLAKLRWHPLTTRQATETAMSSRQPFILFALGSGIIYER
jgi:hypothetical protein